MIKTDVIVIGAGAAGLFCAAEAGKRGRSVLLLDHAKKPGRKILISGGGRCNFTNMYASPENFLSDNPHFCKSALSRYTQWDFVALVEKYNIAYHEKTLGQWFCDDSAKDIVAMLMAECEQGSVKHQMQCDIRHIEKTTSGFMLDTSHGPYQCESLVIATGGLSMPKLGATPFGYQVAEQFGLTIRPTRAGLVPFTLHDKDKQVLAELSGISVNASASCNNTCFNENILFTHRGLSGPAVLQISSFWEPGQKVEFNLYPNGDLQQILEEKQQSNTDAQLATALAQIYPKRFVQAAIPYFSLANKPLKQFQGKQLEQVAQAFEQWLLQPNGTEGYRTAEVTLGGVDTKHLSSKTMMAKDVEGLYFIGEVVDVTGWLGGYNFQWAWSSAWVAGQEV
ncbi:BaiN/RdsA family NAD(P)/FAD-dependent oxidoreductase [Planctobacterium marinum]|uniref:NAD(P)/FAD-dependent oxidoreductase n=1 Tax=Planctobacterium marinum TaxID=1631968 RepID=UPI001E60FE8C|nr:NAD(P)/FAD-dependent oxidoreductase [Planctobacterium marinum]MCC2607757.1 NAD(P)/FAD-dependent oxidoreductase [Planctobacterium marinum]